MMGTSKFGPIRTDLSATWLTPFQVKVIPGNRSAYFRAENAQVDSVQEFP